VGIIFSPESRDLYSQRLLPDFVGELLDRGYCLRGLWEPYTDELRAMDDLRVLVATSAVCLREANAAPIAEWVRRGGTLIATPATGWCDEYGRWRGANPLAEALGQPLAEHADFTVGDGRVVCVADGGAVPASVAEAVAPCLVSGAGVGCHRRTGDDGRTVLALVGHDGPVGEVTVRLPEGSQTPQFLVPGAAPRPLTIQTIAGEAVATVRTAERLALITWQQ